MKNYLGLLLIAVLLIGCSEESSEGTKEKNGVATKAIINKSNADQIKSFDENDIESMVTYYFASRVRHDNKWKDALPDPSKWSPRMKYSLESHGQWNFIEFQNLGFIEGKNGSYVRVRMKIEYKGREQEGEDEVELEKVNGKWVIVAVPS